jgi:hypothetical protein
MRTTSTFLTAIISYFILVVLTSLLTWAIIVGVLVNLDSIPKSVRDGYQNPYITFLAFTGIFLFATFVLYYLFLLFVPGSKRSFSLAVMIGLLAGGIPVIVSYMTTWGLSRTSIGEFVTIILLILAGGSIPFIERKFNRKIA